MRRTEVPPQKAKTAEPPKVAPRKVPEKAKATEVDGSESSVATRWPANTRENGEWIQVPKVLLRRLKHLKLDPRQLWLLLLLQSERYRNRKPRFYWEELAECCGKDRNTVRRWAYELRELGLLGIEECRRPDAHEQARPGYRNERNKFDLGPFVLKVEREQEAWMGERDERRSRRPAKREK